MAIKTLVVLLLRYYPVCDVCRLCYFFAKIDVVVNQVNIYFWYKIFGNNIGDKSMLDLLLQNHRPSSKEGRCNDRTIQEGNQA